MKLRPYQRHTIDSIYEWYRSNAGNVCAVIPTGGGKSILMAQICKEAIQANGEIRILVLASKKELLEQNSNELLTLWPNAPIGIISASIGKKEFGEPITFGGIQTIKNCIDRLGHIDIVLVDEADEINHEDTGVYRSFLFELNPDRVIGFTATPWRVGHGLITDDPAIFDDLIEPVTIEELQRDGFLAKLVSKHTKKQIDITGVHKRGGDYIERELQEKIDVIETNLAAVEETIERAGYRKSWLFFCTGIDHALHIRDILRDKGISAETVTGKTPKSEREEIIRKFRDGEIIALTGVDVFSVGFNAPNIDLIVFLRPTCSARVYVQQAGRGLRLKDHTDNCMILDFAGNIETHGPITDVILPHRKSDEPGIPPSKICPDCDSIIAAQARTCPDCGHVFDVEKQVKEWKLHHDDIMGIAPKEMYVSKWEWSEYHSRKSGKDMIKISYYGEALSDKPIHEYLCLQHEGYALQKAMHVLRLIVKETGANIDDAKTLFELAETMRLQPPPESIEYKMEGKYPRILSRKWQIIPF